MKNGGRGGGRGGGRSLIRRATELRRRPRSTDSYANYMQIRNVEWLVRLDPPLSAAFKHPMELFYSSFFSLYFSSFFFFFFLHFLFFVFCFLFFFFFVFFLVFFFSGSEFIYLLNQSVLGTGSVRIGADRCGFFGGNGKYLSILGDLMGLG